jgi:hypothetical protein
MSGNNKNPAYLSVFEHSPDSTAAAQGVSGGWYPGTRRSPGCSANVGS